MTNLPKFTLDKNKQRDVWELTNDKTDKIIKVFEVKSKATAGGVLEKALGTQGGSVKIKLENNKIQEERTYPGTADPRQSKG